MAIAQFNSLSTEEKDLMYQTPAIVTLLIGGVDDNLDEDEKDKASKAVHYRQVFGDALLFDYFEEVDKTFAQRLDSLHNQYVNLQAEPRTQILIKELEKLNDILPKIDPIFVHTFLKSMRSLSKLVANASGGVLGLLNTSFEEQHLVGLEMITFEV